MTSLTSFASVWRESLCPVQLTAIPPCLVASGSNRTGKETITPKAADTRVRPKLAQPQGARKGGGGCQIMSCSCDAREKKTTANENSQV